MKLTMSHPAAMLVVGALLFVSGVMAGQVESELPPPVPPGVFTALGFVAIVAGFAFIGVARKNRDSHNDSSRHRRGWSSARPVHRPN
jgi:hypothetical protein